MKRNLTEEDIRSSFERTDIRTTRSCAIKAINKNNAQIETMMALALLYELEEFERQLEYCYYCVSELESEIESTEAKLKAEIAELNEVLEMATKSGKESALEVIEEMIELKENQLENGYPTKSMDEYHIEKNKKEIQSLEDKIKTYKEIITRVMDRGEIEAARSKDVYYSPCVYVKQLIFSLAYPQLEEMTRGNFRSSIINWGFGEQGFYGQLVNTADNNECWEFVVDDYRCVINGEDCSEEWVKLIASSLPEKAKERYLARVNEYTLNNGEEDSCGQF